MDARQRFAHTLIGVAMLGILGSPLWGALPAKRAAEKQAIHDVKLTKDRELVGQVVRSTGQPAAKLAVLVTQAKSGQRQTTHTDKQGTFRLPVKQSGVYRVAVGDQSFLIRAWRAEVAPPVARPGILYVTGTAVRGQAAAAGGLTSVLTSPLVIGATIAAAIAVPVAIVETEDDELPDGGSGEPAS